MTEILDKIHLVLFIRGRWFRGLTFLTAGSPDCRVVHFGPVGVGALKMGSWCNNCAGIVAWSWPVWRARLMHETLTWAVAR